MPKYKLVTKTADPDPQKFEIFEEIIDCDNVMIDQTGKYLLFCEASRLEPSRAPQPGGPVPISVKFIKWINTDYVIECFDIQQTSRVVQMLDA